MSSSARVLTIAPDFGGFNNQRIALLGLILTARGQNAKVRLPAMLADYSPEAGELQRLIPIGEVLDEQGLVAFLEDEDLYSEAPANEILHLRNGFQVGGRHLAKLERDFDARQELACRYFTAAAVAPAARRTAEEVVAALGGRDVPALQLRIERDWQRYAADRVRRAGDGSIEHLPTDAEEIVAKVIGSEPFGGVRRIVACCDEADLPSPASEIADRIRQRFGVELLFKADAEQSVAVPDRRLARAAVDFQVCLTVNRYIGLTRSTFSNMVCFVKACGGDEPDHYVYNAAPHDRVVRRVDRGTSADPARAVGAEWERQPGPAGPGRSAEAGGPPDEAQSATERRQRAMIEELQAESAALGRSLGQAVRRADKQETRIAALKRRLADSEASLEAARSSEAMRVGRAVVAPGHLVKRALGRRARG